MVFWPEQPGTCPRHKEHDVASLHPQEAVYFGGRGRVSNKGTLTKMQWKRGLWRLGWVLWVITVAPTVYVARQESIEPTCQFKEDTSIAKPRDIFDQVAAEGLKPIGVPGIGTAWVPKYLTEEQIEKAISSLRKNAAATPPRTVPPIGTELSDEQFQRLNPEYSCTVQWKANRPKVLLYSTLGLSLGFLLIQGGFRLILWVVAGFRGSKLLNEKSQ